MLTPCLTWQQQPWSCKRFGCCLGRVRGVLQQAICVNSCFQLRCLLTTPPVHVRATALAFGCSCCRYEQDRIALDVEHHAQHSYAGVTCLLQLSTGGQEGCAVCCCWQAAQANEICCALPHVGCTAGCVAFVRPEQVTPLTAFQGTCGSAPSPALATSAGAKDFLIDCLALPREDTRSLLAPVLSNPRICKVRCQTRVPAFLCTSHGPSLPACRCDTCREALPTRLLVRAANASQVVHGSGNDVAWLQRDFGLYLVNIFDTEKACQVCTRQASTQLQDMPRAAR